MCELPTLYKSHIQNWNPPGRHTLHEPTACKTRTESSCPLSGNNSPYSKCNLHHHRCLTFSFVQVLFVCFSSCSFCLALLPYASLSAAFELLPCAPLSHPLDLSVSVLAVSARLEVSLYPPLDLSVSVLAVSALLEVFLSPPLDLPVSVLAVSALLEVFLSPPLDLPVSVLALSAPLDLPVSVLAVSSA